MPVGTVDQVVEPNLAGAGVLFVDNDDGIAFRFDGVARKLLKLASGELAFLLVQFLLLTNGNQVLGKLGSRVHQVLGKRNGGFAIEVGFLSGAGGDGGGESFKLGE